MQLSGSRVFSESFRVVKERFGSLLGIWAAFTGIQIAMFAVFGMAFSSLLMAGLAGVNPQQSPFSGMGGGMMAGLFLFYLAYLVVIVAQYGALCAMASPVQQPSFGDALRDGLRSGPTMLGVVILGLIGYLGGALLITLVGGLLGMVLGGVGAFLTIVLALVGLIYVISRISLVLPVAAVERVANPFRVISRAWSLTSGNVFKIILINIVVAIVMMILFGLALAPVMSTSPAFQPGSAEIPDLTSFGLTFVLMLVAGVVAAIFGSAVQSVVHAELAGDGGVNLDDTFA